MSVITDSVVAIQRLKDDTDDSDKEQYQTNEALQAVKCQIQPASPAATAVAEGIFGQTYMMFTSESGILEGDKVTVSGTGEIYRVKGIEDWSMDPVPHFEITLLEFDEEKTA